MASSALELCWAPAARNKQRTNPRAACRRIVQPNQGYYCRQVKTAAAKVSDDADRAEATSDNVQNIAATTYKRMKMVKRAGGALTTHDIADSGIPMSNDRTLYVADGCILSDTSVLVCCWSGEFTASFFC